MVSTESSARVFILHIQLVLN